MNYEYEMKKAKFKFKQKFLKTENNFKLITINA